jgi:hypothetical protein
MYIQTRHHNCRISEFVYRGHTVVCLENRFLRIPVLLTKGADIMEFRYKPLDIDFLWHAPQDLPLYGSCVASSPSQKYGNFLDFWYGAWQESLPSGVGSSIYKNAELGIHGEVSLLPWQAQVLQDSAERISVLFVVRTRRTPFCLTRVMTLHKDECFVRMDEELHNEGEESMEFVWGHHPVFGPPFLEEGCIADSPGGKIHTPPEAYCAWTRYAPAEVTEWPKVYSKTKTLLRYDLVPSKDARCEDISYVSDLPDGWVAIRNPRLELGVYMVWDKEVFPYTWNWQAYGGSYSYPFYGRCFCWAIEPFSSPLSTFSQNVENGTVKRLQAGESMKTTLIAGAFTGKNRVVGCSADGSIRREE